MARVFLNDSILTDIADAIREQSNTTGLIRTSQMAQKIRALPDTGLLPPDKYYAKHRPDEWLQMPSVSSREMYFLMRKRHNDTIKIIIPCGCTAIGDEYSIEVGHCLNGEFVPFTNESYQFTYNGNVAWRSLTIANGIRIGTTQDSQFIVRISGDMSIVGWPAYEMNYGGNKRRNAPVLEFVGKDMDNLSNLGYPMNAVTNRPSELRLFGLYGSNSITDGSGMFYHAYNLECITALDTSKMTSMSMMFYGCARLRSIPAFAMTANKIGQQMFSGCQALQGIPAIDTSVLTNCDQMFQKCGSLQSISLDLSACVYSTSMFNGCTSLVSADIRNTNNVIDATRMFAYCDNLKNISAIDMPKCTNMQSIFEADEALESVTFTNMSLVSTATNMFYLCDALRKITGFDMRSISKYSAFDTLTCLEQITFNSTKCEGIIISLSYVPMTKQAIQQMFTSLPVITSTKAIVLTGVIQRTELDDDTIRIATQKGWTVTI